MATQLGLYNGALVTIGAARLATISDAEKSRRELDEVYAQVLAECLEAGQWNFAIRTSQEDSDGTPTVHDFGYYFTKPTDWVKTAMVSASSSFNPPLTEFEEEGDKWYARVDPLFVKYVSNDGSWGGNLTAFPPAYARFVELSLAERVCLALTGNRSLLDRLRDRDLPKARSRALSHDAMNGPTRFLPEGRFVRSRGYGLDTTRHDRAP